MKIIQEIFRQHNLSVVSYEPLHGGDINQVYRVTTDKGDFVLKRNDAIEFPKMFEAEAEGLAALRATNTFIIPDVVGVDSFEQSAFLILEFLPAANPSNWSIFGEQLAALHQHTREVFGFGDNYIGSLPQSNSAATNPVTYFISERLEPQFQLARKSGYAFNTDTLFKRLVDIIPDEPASLIHGDLWSGNYLSTPNGFALIDPAVAYAPREMDVAMMKLFGGFPKVVFEAYDASFPVMPGFDRRLEIWQLYYLLVHLNLFGRAYLSQVNGILNRFG